MRFSIILFSVWAIPAIVYCILFYIGVYLLIFGIDIMEEGSICDRFSGWCVHWFLRTSPLAIILPILYYIVGI